MSSRDESLLPIAVAPAAVRLAEARRTFSERIRSTEAIVVPGVTDGLAGRLVERAGFEACYATGAGIANVQYGVPDIGLVTMTEMADQVRRITDSVSIPVIVDADTGHGGPLSVMRTIHILEAAGAASIQIEDQGMPKRCGHFEGHKLVETWEMQSKIDAACAARGDNNLTIIARTDSLGIHGINEAITRGRAYLLAGADALFIEAPRTIEELRRIGGELGDAPLIANVVEGGLTPQLSAAEFSELGFTIVLFANFLMRIMAKAGEDGLSTLRKLGDSKDLADSMLSWPERQELVDLDDYSLLDDSFQSWDKQTSPPSNVDGRANTKAQATSDP
jgi:2-methylisocitrate lyase-like PEP mutase family enzyme